MSIPISDRELGVYFGDFGESLSEHEYPVTVSELREEYGDEQLQISGETISFSELLEPIEETFESGEELLATILMMVGMDAVGRKRYTDRGGSPSIEHEIGPQDSL